MSLRDKAKAAAKAELAEKAKRGEALVAYFKDLKSRKALIGYKPFEVLCKKCNIKGGLAKRMEFIPKELQFLVAPKPNKDNEIVHSQKAIENWGKDYRPNDLIKQSFDVETLKKDDAWFYCGSADDVLEDFEDFEKKNSK